MDNEKKIEIPFGAFDSELIHQEISIPNGFNATIEGDKIILTRAESEDEKIRKWLIGYFHQYKEDGMERYANGLKVDDILAWLEKQGKQEPINPELKESEDEEVRKEIITFISTTPKQRNRHPKWINWLEKQGEKEPIIEMKSAEESLGIDSETYNKIVDECIYGEQKPNYTTLAETGNGGINALVTRELPTNGCGDEQNPADKAEPIVVRDFNSVFSREKVKEIDKRIEKSQKLYNAKLRDAMRKVEDFPMTD